MTFFAFPAFWQDRWAALAAAVTLDSTKIGPAVWISLLNVKYRDFRYVISFIVQFGLHGSPVGLVRSSRSLPVAVFNQSNGRVIDGFRWCILPGQSELYMPGLLTGIAVIAFLLWFGVRQIRRTEKSFADLI